MLTPKRKISNTQELKDRINELERKIQTQEVEMKVDYGRVKENIQPKVIVKNTFSHLAETPEIQRTLVNTVIGIIVGYASKRAVQALSEHTLNRTVENIVGHHLGKLENNNPNSLLSQGISLFRKFTPKNSPIYPFVRYK